MQRLNESRIGAVIAEAFAVRAATAMESSQHAQHGAALIVGLDSDVTVIGPGGARCCGRTIVVPPDWPHAASCPGPTLGLIFDPEQAPRLASYSRQHGGGFVLEGRPAARLHGAFVSHRTCLPQPSVLEGLARECSALLGQEAPGRGPDARVARLLEALRDPDGEPQRVAAQTRLSPAHLQALFVRDVGLPLRTFRLWRRLLVALVEFSRSDATSGAHAAGFADLAHFSRTCRRMLGYSPTTLRDELLLT